MIQSILFWLLWPVFWLVLPLQRRARVLIFNETGDLLLVKNRLAPNRWQLPGGGIKHAESIERAARRELQEELSLNVEALRVLNHEPETVVMFGLITHLHFCTVQLKDEVTVTPNIEIRAFEWFDLQQLPSARAGDVDAALERYNTLEK